MTFSFSLALGEMLEVKLVSEISISFSPNPEHERKRGSVEMGRWPSSEVSLHSRVKLTVR